MAPLRDRRADIRLLLDLFATRRAQPVHFTEPALEMLLRYRWPGNVRELQNIVEQAAWQSETTEIGTEHLPAHIRVSEGFVHTRERRRRVADDLYEALSAGHYSSQEHIHPLFLSRDITRHDIRELVRRGLQATRGSYRGLIGLFNMQPRDYQRFHNFLTAHGCKVEFREFRNGDTPLAPQRRTLDPLAGASRDVAHQNRDSCV